MTFAPTARGVVPHASHRFIGGRCHYCATAPHWPIAGDPCALRNYEQDAPKWTSLRVRERIERAYALLDEGKSIRETARIVGVDKKTIVRYSRLRAKGE